MSISPSKKHLISFLKESAQIPYKGTGIGLPLVKSFIALHGGNVRIESSKGSGTTVYCRIPLLEESSLSDSLSYSKVENSETVLPFSETVKLSQEPL